MKDLNLLPVSIERILSLCHVDYHIDNDLVITDFNSIPFPEDTRHMECIFVGLCTSGEGHYSIGTVGHRVKANDVIIVGDGQILGDIRTTKEFEGQALLISHEFLYDVIRDVRDVSNLFVFSREHPIFSLTDEDVEMFRRYVEFLKSKVADETHAFRKEVTGTLLASMIYDLCNATSQAQQLHSRQTKSQEVFEHFIQLVEANFRHERRISWYGEQLGISSKTLLGIVKRVSNRTPNDWLDIYTTLEIRLMLRHTTKSIAEIAEELHFGTQSSLGKFFKEHVGMSPTAYRK